MKLHHTYGNRHTLGRFRLSATAASNPLELDELPEKIRQILEVVPGKRDDAQKKRLAAYYRSVAPSLADEREKLASLKKEKKKVRESLPKTLVSVSRDQPRETHILKRGNWMNPGRKVGPAVPHFLPEMDSSKGRPTRLDLAKWLVRRDNPLTARVFVNRLWMLFFGEGLVRTPADLGTQGKLPTHPELLDWLAVEFMESGWDVKHMVRLMVTSSAYRQSSDATEEKRKADPKNKLVGRQGRFRLPAEMVRNNALAVAGMLSRKMGGPSVKPYQPDGYWKHLNFPKRTYKESEGEDLYRRGLYTFWQRTFLHPAMKAFDAPNRQSCTVERPESNTPLQALVLLNDKTYVEAARVLAGRVARRTDLGVERKVHHLFRRVLGRKASSEEVDRLTSLFRRHRKQYKRDASAAKRLVRVGEWPVPAHANPATLAAWTSVCRVVLNLNETITRF